LLLRGLNVILIALIIISAIKLITKRYEIRLGENDLAQLKSKVDILDKEYSRLEIEFGTYSSNLVLKDFAIKRLQLIKPDAKQLLGVDSNAGKK
jgi:cell division protein FtsL